jgi:hypothetical protein
MAQAHTTMLCRYLSIGILIIFKEMLILMNQDATMMAERM